MKHGVKLDRISIDVRPTASSRLKGDRGKKLMEKASDIAFLRRLGPVSIRKIEPTSIVLEHGGLRAVLHPDGRFHLRQRNRPLSSVALVERWTREMGSLVGETLGRSPKFEISVTVHHEFSEKSIVGGTLAALKKVSPSDFFRRESSLSKSEPIYIAFEVDPTLQMGFGEDGHIDVYFEPKPISPGDMKDKYLVSPLVQALDLILREFA